MAGIGRVGIVPKVEIAFGVPFGTTPGSGDWIDVTSAVRGAGPVSFKWGRSAWTGQGAATLELALRNPTGDFTPNLPSSTYYPNVRAGQRIRLSVDVTVPAGGLTFTDLGDGTDSMSGPSGFDFDRGDGSLLMLIGGFTDPDDGTLVYTGSPVTRTVYLFDAPITSWEVTWEDGVYSVAQIEAADVLGRYGVTTPLYAMLYEEILKDLGAGNTGSFYPFNDQGPTLGDFRNVFPPLTAYATAGGPDIAFQNVTGCADQSVVGVGLGGYFSYIGGVGFALSAGMAVELFFVTSFTGFTAVLIGDHGGDLTIGIDVNGHVTDGTTTGPFVANGLLHQLLYLPGDGWYVDGVRYGDVAIDTVDYLGFNLVGTVWCFGIYFAAPSLARFADHLTCARTGFAGESTDAHLARILGYRLNLGSDRDAGLGHVGVHATDGLSLQQAIYDTAEAEGSVAFAGGTAQVKFRSRLNLFSPPPTWILDGSKVGQIGPATTFRSTTEGIVNTAAATGPSGATQKYQDDASIADVGVFNYPGDLNLIVETDAQALAAAKWRVQVGTQDQTAPTQLDANLYTIADPNTVLSLLQLQPLDVVRLSNLPSTAPSTEDFMVQGGSMTISPESFALSLFTTVVPVGDPY